MNIDTAIIAAFNASNVVITDKNEREASRWASATARGDILGQSIAQTALGNLIGGDAAIRVLSIVGNHV